MKINIDHNDIIMESTAVLADALKINTKLGSLRLSLNFEFFFSKFLIDTFFWKKGHCNISAAGINEIFEALKNNTALTHLDLCGDSSISFLKKQQNQKCFCH